MQNIQIFLQTPTAEPLSAPSIMHQEPNSDELQSQTVSFSEVLSDAEQVAKNIPKNTQKNSELTTQVVSFASNDKALSAQNNVKTDIFAASLSVQHQGAESLDVLDADSGFLTASLLELINFSQKQSDSKTSSELRLISSDSSDFDVTEDALLSNLQDKISLSKDSDSNIGIILPVFDKTVHADLNPVKGSEPEIVSNAVSLVRGGSLDVDALYIEDIDALTLLKDTETASNDTNVKSDEQKSNTSTLNALVNNTQADHLAKVESNIQTSSEDADLEPLATVFDTKQAPQDSDVNSVKLDKTINAVSKTDNAQNLAMTTSVANEQVSQVVISQDKNLSQEIAELADKPVANTTSTTELKTNADKASLANSVKLSAEGLSAQSDQAKQNGQEQNFTGQQAQKNQGTQLAMEGPVTATDIQASQVKTVLDTSPVLKTDTAATLQSHIQALDARQQASATQESAKTLAEQLKQSVNLLQQDAAGQLRERVNFMVRQNIQIAEIRLDPAGLGQMQIKIDMQQEQASVQFIVQQSQAKDLLEQQMPRLRDMLQQQGLQLAESQVQQQSQQEQKLAQQQGQSSNNRQAAADDESEGDMSQTVDVKAPSADRLVDYYA